MAAWRQAAAGPWALATRLLPGRAAGPSVRRRSSSPRKAAGGGGNSGEILCSALCSTTSPFAPPPRHGGATDSLCMHLAIAASTRGKPLAQVTAQCEGPLPWVSGCHPATAHRSPPAHTWQAGTVARGTCSRTHPPARPSSLHRAGPRSSCVAPMASYTSRVRRLRTHRRVVWDGSPARPPARASSLCSHAPHTLTAAPLPASFLAHAPTTQRASSWPARLA